MAITLTRTPRHRQGVSASPHLWEISQFDIEATDKTDTLLVAVKGQEASIWNVALDPKYYYHIVPNTAKRGVIGDFILRLFTSKPVVLETMPDIMRIVEKGEWRRAGEVDSTGGPPTLIDAADGSVKSNPKWCQNPQYHLQIADPYAQEEIFLKIVLRRVDITSRKFKQQRPPQSSQHASGLGIQAVAAKKSDATIGLVVCKAAVLDDNRPKAMKKPVRQNKLGEVSPHRLCSHAGIMTCSRTREPTQPLLSL